MDNGLIDACVTLICERGCAYVRDAMAALREGGYASETVDATAPERQQILRELELIMAVYDARP